MHKKVAIVFPGQGSQYPGMGREFFANSAEARKLMDRAEALCGLPLTRLCLEGPLEELTRSVNLQPALTVANLMCWQALVHELPDMRPCCFAGHSLGEFSALAAAGVVGLDAVLRLVVRRGELMEREALAHPGGMRAVLGLEVDDVRRELAEMTGSGIAVVANHNTRRQVVLSGDDIGLNAVCERLQQQGAKIIPLKVALANHSPLVAGAVPDLNIALEQENWRRPLAPVYSNVSAMPEQEPEVIRELLARQLASPVRWYESVCHMLAAGIDVFVEVGPKNVLTGILRKIVPTDGSIRCLQVENPAGIQALALALAE